MRPRFFLIVLMALLVLTPCVIGMGIGPAKTTIDYIGPETRDGNFHIFRERSEPYSVRLETDGQLAPYITLDRTELTLDQDTYFVPYTLRIPEGLPPGPNEGRVIVTEIIGPVQPGQGVGVTLLRIPHKIIVNVPFPDKYVKADVTIKSDDEKVEFISVVKNTGTLPLREVQATYEIHEFERSIAVLSSQSTALDPLGAGSISAQIDRSKLPNGQYEAAAIIEFDNSKMEIAKTFEIGEPTLIITNHDQFFSPDHINPFALELYNDWNADISDLSLEVSISQAEKPITTIKTFSFSITAHETKKIETFWDTRGLLKGEYDAIITTHIGNRKVNRKVSLSIKEGAISSFEESSSYKDYLLIIALIMGVITLLGVIINLILVLRKRPPQ